MSQKNPKPSPSGKTPSSSRPTENRGTSSPKNEGHVPETPTGPLPPLFRGMDWWCFFLTALVMMIGYCWTLAPDLTLEDSGELAVASKYAGVPHPPGYPVWTVYTWLFTKLPISNYAYRVGLSSAFAGALACGFIALMVSRGSSMLVEGVSFFKGLDRRLENWFCLISGLVAGLMMGFNGFMWSQAVIVEVYTLSVLSLTGVLLFLMRWIYAPHQNRYLYGAFFLFGICFNNHQSLLVTAMGLEVAVIAAAPRVGRELLFWNVMVFIAGLILGQLGFIQTLNENPPVMLIFCGVGFSSIVAWIWLAVSTRKRLLEILRDLCLVAWLGCAALILGNLTNYVEIFDANPGRFTIVCLLFGVSFATFVLLTFFANQCNVKPLGKEWWTAFASGLAWAAGSACYIYMPLASMSNPPLNWGYPRTVTGFIHAFTRGQYERIHPTTESITFLKQIYYTLIDGTLAEFNVMCLVFGLVLILWWLVRQPWKSSGRTLALGGGIGLLVLMTFLLSSDVVGWVEQHRLNAIWVLVMTAVYLALAPVFALLMNPTFLFWKEMQKRERAWIIGLTAIYICLGPFLMLLLNPSPDRQAQELNKVFFTASQVLISMGIGYGITLMLALMALYYGEIRKALLQGFAVVTVVAIFILLNTFGVFKAIHAFSWASDPTASGLNIFTAFYAVALTAAAFALVWINPQTAPIRPFLLILALAPGYSVLSHWENNEQRGHLFGYWFGHDMFTPPFKGKDGKPLYPEMDKHTILFGGTDPGRFNPTYMIFCESFLEASKKPHDPNFDRRDVYLITQNALADGTYLQYIRAHYNRSTQPDPPFFTELFRGPRELANNIDTNRLAKMMVPIDRFFLDLGDRIEKDRRVGSSYFDSSSFTDLKGFTARLKASADPVSKFVFDSLSAETKSALNSDPSGNSAQSKLIQDLNKLLEAGPIFETNRFAQVNLSQHVKWFVEENPQGHTRIRLNRLLLEESYPKELAKSPGGVYPDREIKTPSNDDSQRCFNDYISDANRRLDHDMKNPNGPRMIRPGEDVRVVGGRVQVSGQVAVMSINGLLTKVIFDNNPNHEFYVEESFPLDWMYPYLTPFGIIMKINRNPVNELTEEILDRDHQFWTQYSDRLVGNFIGYDTSISTICQFAEQVYLRKDFRGFTGDRAFVRDNDAQKAFSKLRSSIGGLYAWRMQNTRNAAEQQRVLKEAEFAFKQAFAYCPYSPEAVFRYINILVTLNRMDDALLLTRTAQKFDPANGQLKGLIDELERIRRVNGGGIPQAQGNPPPTQMTPEALRGEVDQMSVEFGKNPANLQVATRLVQGHLMLQETNAALLVIDKIMAASPSNSSAMLFSAQFYNALMQFPRAEVALSQYARLMGEHPEAWFDLAGMQAILSRPKEALESLSKSLAYEAKRNASQGASGGDPAAPKNNLLELAKTDPRFGFIRESAEFKAMIARYSK